MRILLVDDHPIVRKGLKEILSEEIQDVRFGEARTASEAISLVRKEPWDIVVLDITLPGRSGLDALKEIKQAKPKLPVFVLSMHAEDQFAIRVLKAGGDGYMTKDMASDSLVEAIKQVRSGQRYVSASLAQKLALHIEKGSEKLPHEALSDREYQVLRMIGSGKTVTQIGLELSLSVKTVSTYRSRILEKMKLKNNAEITLYTVRHALTD